MKVPFVDLQTENEKVEKRVMAQILAMAKSSAFTLGPPVAEFEKKFAAFCKTDYCLGLNSGTEALHLALLACGVQTGDEVITTPMSHVSTSLAIAYTGAKPVFVDVMENGMIDARLIEAAITKKTKAILPVHLYGNAYDVDALRAIAKKHNLYVIDDCAHGQGAHWKGKPIGSLADISCFSFYPTKNLGAWGNAGCITTDHKELYERVKLFKNFGGVDKNYSIYIGNNTRMDTIQAIVLKEKLTHLAGWNRKRLAAAAYYTKHLAGVGDAVVPIWSPESSYYVFSIKTKNRDALQKFLVTRGIDALIHYPLAIHLQECFAYLGYKVGDLPVSERHAATELSLPLYSAIPKSHLDRVIASIKLFYAGIEKTKAI